MRPGFVRTPMTAPNRFRMPFLLEPEDAARRAVRALERGRPVCSFPLPMAAGMRALALLPSGLYARVLRRRG